MTDTDISDLLLQELHTLNKTHSEILATLLLLAHPEIEKRLSHIFLNPIEFQAYKLSDGKNTSTDIGNLVKVSHTTITNWWKKWEEDYGIIETSGYRNPYKAKYSLVELALLLGKQRDNEKE